MDAMPDTAALPLTDAPIDTAQLSSLFQTIQNVPYLRLAVSSENADNLKQLLGIPVRRCYITDEVLHQRATELSLSMEEVLATKLPDPGSTMSGDFGEILTYLYHIGNQHPQTVFGPKKWRLKQDRTKPAPYSDVVHFLLPSWPVATDQDELLCSEVKTKATDGNSLPISSAITDSQKDATSRLAKTLVWLREKAISDGLGDVSLAHLNRFINATDHPSFQKRFYAVAVICADLVENEILNDPPSPATGHTLVLIVVPKLRDVYTAAYESARQSVVPVIGEES
jgi:hypothetical protein